MTSLSLWVNHATSHIDFVRLCDSGEAPHDDGVGTKVSRRRRRRRLDFADRLSPLANGNEENERARMKRGGGGG